MFEELGDRLDKAIGKIKGFLQEHNCKFSIYGPDYKGRYEQVSALIRENGVDDVVSLHHEIFDEKKEETLLNADCFIQTSRFEGMPMGILEALSYGIPCLITTGTTLEKTIKESGAGWVCDTTADAIAQTIIRAVTERETLKDKSYKARKLIADKFAWDNVAKQTINKYKLLLDKL